MFLVLMHLCKRRKGRAISRVYIYIYIYIYPFGSLNMNQTTIPAIALAGMGALSLCMRSLKCSTGTMAYIDASGGLFSAESFHLATHTLIGQHVCILIV